jgi:aspartyl-tRNA(Asn)/glutamyl-tRNA(Gln) amidotransferase subunit B
MPEYEAIIGLETHIQLNTTTKIFCTCKADSWDDPPNTNICPVCTGLPGVLPVLNQLVVEKAALLAAAMQADIQPVSYFDRKNYFYPDLPKGYQISQFDMPLARGGYLNLPMPEGYTRRVTIDKLHIEEDAGKTVNENGQRLIDFNRCGVPLVEMVTEPDLRSAEEVAQYLIRLRQLLRWLEISEADMEKGHLRTDANVSIRPKGVDYLNPKTEIKNVNSVVSLRDAIKAEIDRQIKQVEAGGQIEAWTLDWDDGAGVLRKSRPGPWIGMMVPVSCARCALRRPKRIIVIFGNPICCPSTLMKSCGKKSRESCLNCPWNAENVLLSSMNYPNMMLTY